jgi:hypothetical protein
MSSPVFFKGTDGNFYANPLFFGDDWFITLDERPEIVIARKSKHTADDLLKEHLPGVRLRRTARPHLSSRPLPVNLPCGEGEGCSQFVETKSYDLAILDPIPVPHLHHGCGPDIRDIKVKPNPILMI